MCLVVHVSYSFDHVHLNTSVLDVAAFMLIHQNTFLSDLRITCNAYIINMCTYISVQSGRGILGLSVLCITGRFLVNRNVII